MLGPAGHLRLGDTRLGHLLLERFQEGLDPRLPLRLFLRHLADQGDVLLGLQELERQILEFRLGAGHPEPVGQWRVDFPRFRGDPFPSVGREVLQGPHVVEPVGELDDDDPGVLGNREEELPVVLDLLLGPGAEGQVGDLREPVHQARHLGSELRRDVVDAHFGILDHVVQQRRRDRGRVEQLAHQDRGHRDTVRHELLARHPLLTAVGRGTELERALDQTGIEAIGVTSQRGAQLDGAETLEGIGHSSP